MSFSVLPTVLLLQRQRLPARFHSVSRGLKLSML